MSPCKVLELSTDARVTYRALLVTHSSQLKHLNKQINEDCSNLYPGEVRHFLCTYIKTDSDV